MKNFKKIVCAVLAALMLLSIAGCSSTTPKGNETQAAKADTSAKETSAAKNDSSAEKAKSTIPNEEYAMIMALPQLEFFNDHKNGLKDAADRLGAKSYFAGPQDWAPEKIVEAIDQAVAKKVTGIIVIGQSPDSGVAIDNAMKAGIPVIVVASDIPSNRLTNIGANYYNGGVKIGEAMAKALNGKGKVATSNALSANQPSANALQKGVEDALAKHPDIKLVARLDDKADPALAPTVCAQALQANPDIDAFIGLDAVSAIGAATAVREAGKTGKVKISSLDRDSATLELIEKGEILSSFAQKSYVESYMAVNLLHDYLAGNLKMVNDYLNKKVNPLPYAIDTSFVEINKGNVTAFKR